MIIKHDNIRMPCSYLYGVMRKYIFKFYIISRIKMIYKT